MSEAEAVRRGEAHRPRASLLCPYPADATVSRCSWELPGASLLCPYPEAMTSRLQRLRRGAPANGDSEAATGPAPWGAGRKRAEVPAPAARGPAGSRAVPRRRGRGGEPVVHLEWFTWSQVSQAGLPPPPMRARRCGWRRGVCAPAGRVRQKNSEGDHSVPLLNRWCVRRWAGCDRQCLSCDRR